MSERLKLRFMLVVVKCLQSLLWHLWQSSKAYESEKQKDSDSRILMDTHGMVHDIESELKRLK